jgi:hypothetical protein
MRLLIFLLIGLSVHSQCWAQQPSTVAQPKDRKANRSQLGKLLGTVLVVQGVVVQIDDKGSADEPHLLVQKIGDSAIQQRIVLPLSVHTGA